MPKHTRSAAESDAIRSSHSLLLNQLVKAEKGIDPFSTLLRYRSRSDKNCVRVEMPKDMVRDLFNHLRLPEIALSQSYQVLLRSRSGAVVAGKNHISPDARSTTLVFRSWTGEVSFIVHGYITESLQIEGEHRMLDPKSLKFQGRVKVEPEREHDNEIDL